MAIGLLKSIPKSNSVGACIANYNKELVAYARVYY
jgi:hypothetical protein